MRKNIFFLFILPILSVKFGFAQLCFSPATSYTVGLYSESVCSADFNGDGNADLAVANAGLSNVFIFLGTGIGTFNSPVTFAVGSDPESIISADFNGDGKIDLVTANLSAKSVSVLLGTGTGSFSTATNFMASTTNPYSVCSADFNGDGKLDLATANYYNTSSSVSVLLGTGTGSFGVATSFTVGSINPQPEGICSADFNGDGKADLATANTSEASISVLIGTGTGTFNPPINFPVTGQPESVISKDFNGDTKLDLATTGAGFVSVLLGTGTGSFGTVSNFPVGADPESVCSADFDGDGKTDLAVANAASANISVLLGNGTGSFGVAVNFPIGSNQYPVSIISSDFNNDGKADLATSTDTVGDLLILLNCNGVGISNFGSREEISVYPDPATTSISLNTESIFNYTNSTITIQNALGETVKKLSFTKDIDVSDLNNGIYFLQITLSDGETYKTKFIKQ